ncbi:MAG: hypothetical protein AABW49_03445 [Nanoarchaeota archaeon]
MGKKKIVLTLNSHHSRNNLEVGVYELKPGVEVKDLEQVANSSFIGETSIERPIDEVANEITKKYCPSAHRRIDDKNATSHQMTLPREVISKIKDDYFPRRLIKKKIGLVKL